MTMETQPDHDGVMRIRLSPFERKSLWFITVIIMSAGGIFAKSVLTRLDKIGDIDTRTLLMQQQVNSLAKQLNDAPSKADLIKLEVRVDRHDEDIKELRAIK